MSETTPSTTVAPSGKPRGALAVNSAGQDVAVSEEAKHAEQLILEYQSPAAAQLAMPVPMRSRYTTYIIFCLFMSMFAVALLLPIDRVVSGASSVITVEPQTGLSAFETGIVRAILVRPGQAVRKGDLLMTLDPTNATSAVTSYSEQLDSLTQETRRLRAELDNKVYLSDGTRHGELQASLYTQRHAELSFQVESFNQQILALRAQAAQAEADVRAYTGRLTFASSVEDKRRELERLGVGSQLNTMSAADQRTEMLRFLEVARGQLNQTRGALAAKISDRDAALEQWRNVTAQSLKDQGDKLTQVLDALTKARMSLQQVELRAPFDATVFDIAPSNTGTVVSAGSQLLTLTPISTQLEMEGVIDALNAGFLRRGQRVSIKFDTFPYSSHGTGLGTVRVISPDASRQPYSPISTPASVTQSQQAFGNLYYKVRVTIDAADLRNVPPDFKPLPGMQGSIDILVGHRTFIEYLFSRFVVIATEGFREP